MRQSSGIIDRVSPNIDVDRDAITAFCERHHAARFGGLPPAIGSHVAGQLA